MIDWKEEFFNTVPDEVIIVGFPFITKTLLLARLAELIALRVPIKVVAPNPGKPFFFQMFAKAEETRDHALNMLRLFEPVVEEEHISIHLLDAPLPRYYLVFGQFVVCINLGAGFAPGPKIDPGRVVIDAERAADSKRTLISTYFSRPERKLGQVDLFTLMDKPLPSMRQGYGETDDEFRTRVYKAFEPRCTSLMGHGIIGGSEWHGSTSILTMEAHHPNFIKDAWTIQKAVPNIVICPEEHGVIVQYSAPVKKNAVTVTTPTAATTPNYGLVIWPLVFVGIFCLILEMLGMTW